MKINIGCGDIAKEGYVGIDINPAAKGADIIHDFDTLDICQVDEIYGRMCLHHFPSPEKTLRKCKNICKGRIFFEAEPIRGIFVPERLAYYFSPFRDMKRNPEEKAPTIIQWKLWARKAGVSIKMRPIRLGRGFSRFQNRAVDFLMLMVMFYIGNPFRPLSYWSVDMEVK